MKHYYFVRHGQTQWNAIARMQGQLESDLTALGRKQAEIGAQLLAGLDIEAIFASPLRRTRQTAEIINQYVDAPLAFDSRIVEWDCGDWSGHLHSDVKAKWPAEWAALEADRFNYRGPGCENFPDMIERAAPFVDELLAAPAERVAVISHGMIGRVMIGILMGFSTDKFLGFSQPNDVVYRTSLPAESTDGVPKLHYYLKGRGPIPGATKRW